MRQATPTPGGDGLLLLNVIEFSPLHLVVGSAGSRPETGFWEVEDISRASPRQKTEIPICQASYTLALVFSHLLLVVGGHG